jgi:hypothetical protein
MLVVVVNVYGGWALSFAKSAFNLSVTHIQSGHAQQETKMPVAT